MAPPAQSYKLNKHKHKTVNKQHMGTTYKNRGHPECVAVRARWSLQFDV